MIRIRIRIRIRNTVRGKGGGREETEIKGVIERGNNF
jgi:hypothetical protein